MALGSEGLESQQIDSIISKSSPTANSTNTKYQVILPKMWARLSDKRVPLSKT